MALGVLESIWAMQYVDVRCLIDSCSYRHTGDRVGRFSVCVVCTYAFMATTPAPPRILTVRSRDRTPFSIRMPVS